jgi:hypothetical protein
MLVCQETLLSLLSCSDSFLAPVSNVFVLSLRCCQYFILCIMMSINRGYAPKSPLTAALHDLRFTPSKYLQNPENNFTTELFSNFSSNTNTNTNTNTK